MANKKVGKKVGKNPRLSQAKSKNDKNISGLLNQMIDNREAGRIGSYTPYLASINNLSSAVIKTTDKTMKITYELTEVTE